LAAAAVLTSLDQSGLVKPTAPEYGLSTCLPLGGMLALTDGDGEADGDVLGDTEADGEVLGDGDGEELGDVDGEGLADGEVLGLGDADGLVVTGPLQTAPFRVNEVGTGLLEVQVPLKPMVVLAPVARAPFQLMLVAVTCCPETVQLALQPCWTPCPAAGKSNARVQLETGALRLVMTTLPVKPPCHWLCTV